MPDKRINELPVKTADDLDLEQDYVLGQGPEDPAAFRSPLGEVGKLLKPTPVRSRVWRDEDLDPDQDISTSTTTLTFPRTVNPVPWLDGDTGILLVPDDGIYTLNVFAMWGSLGTGYNQVWIDRPASGMSRWVRMWQEVSSNYVLNSSMTVTDFFEAGEEVSVKASRGSTYATKIMLGSFEVTQLMKL